MVELSDDRFAELVEDAFRSVPPELASLLDNVALFIEDDPPADDPDLLGLYDGVAMTERDGSYGLELPDRIFIFRNPLLDMCESEEELVDEVRITVVHEIAHHFGIDDEQLHAWGWG